MTITSLEREKDIMRRDYFSVKSYTTFANQAEVEEELKKVSFCLYL